MEAKSAQQPKPTKQPTATETTAEPVVEIEPEQPCAHSSKTGFIVGIILGVVAILLIAVACAWVCVYNSSAKVTSDAMNKLFSAENVALDGSILLESNDQNSQLEELIVFFDSASTRLPNASHVALRGNLKDGSEINLDAGTAVMQDGVMYLQLSGLIDTLTEFGVGEDDLGWLYEAIEIVDNEWWRIDVQEISTALELDKEDAERLENLQTCVTQELDNDVRTELGELYSSNNFIDLAKVDEIRFDDGSSYGKSFDGTDYYNLVPDYHKMAGFVNGLADLRTTKRLLDCVHDNYPEVDLSTEDFNEVTAGELEQTFDGDTKVEAFLEISRWGHELKHLVSRITDDDATAMVNLTFTYKQANIIVPENYRPITDLIDDISDTVTEFYQGIHLENNSGVTLI